MSRRATLGWAGLALSIPLLLYLGLLQEAGSGSPAELFARVSGGDSLLDLILRELTLPRLCAAFLSGAILTLGGFMMQALVRNPLADPYIMGLSAGAGFAANLRILGLLGIGSGLYFLPLYAFLGACLSILLLLGLGYRAMRSDSPRLLLAGIAVSSMFMAATGLLIYLGSDAEKTRQFVFWSFGSFNGMIWDQVWIMGVLLLVFAIYALWVGNRLDILALGEAQAGALGMHTGRIRLGLLMMTALCVGGSIAFTGPIGFVGLMIPHFSRSICGMRHRANLLFGILLGGSFLMACDILSRQLYPGTGLPIGVVTAILGVPFFLYLLFFSRFEF